MFFSFKMILVEAKNEGHPRRFKKGLRKGQNSKMLPMYLRCCWLGRLETGQGVLHCSDPTNAEIIRT
jgi:hypothetical protein